MNIDDVRPGIRVKADGGFTCITPGAVLTIQVDEEGFPFVPCCEGGHWLNGQIDGNGNLIGFEKV